MRCTGKLSLSRKAAATGGYDWKSLRLQLATFHWLPALICLTIRVHRCGAIVARNLFFSVGEQEQRDTHFRNKGTPTFRFGYIDSQLPPILSRLRISPEQWRINTSQFEAIHRRRFNREVPQLNTG
jgi:hypothetical protein